MLLRLIREPSIDGATLGSLYVDGAWQCWTLEDAIREVKIAGETAIPPGRYRVAIYESVRFKRPMPHVLDVPNFTGILIHPGNTTADTEGCILVGQRREPARITESRLAFDALVVTLRGATLPIVLLVENPLTA